MGHEIAGERFGSADFHRFSGCLRQETELLQQWYRTGMLAERPLRMGYELEAWLVDAAGRPAPENGPFLERLSHPHVVPELARYNVELNGHPHRLVDDAFRCTHRELGSLWRRCETAAGELGLRPLMIGIPPTVRVEDLGIDAMSPLPRYRALNAEVLALRNRRPLHVEISGSREAISQDRRDVMLEAAATSLQLHLQLPPSRAGRYFNAAMLLSAATVALAANSPFLFGRALWQETRIPLFEQAVAVDPVDGAHGVGAPGRVTFGTGFVHGDALLQLFVENQEQYPVLLPQCSDTPPERLAHLSLHNGTIWRWNRPLVGFDGDGRCHLRLEHRVMAAGPTVVDVVANAVFFYGALQACVDRDRPLEKEIPFAAAAGNFYAAARYGLDAELRWLNGARVVLRELLLQSLIPKADAALQRLGLAPEAFRPYLEIVRARVASGRTGAAWQLGWAERHGRDLAGLVSAYLGHQAGGRPVHEWPP